MIADVNPARDEHPTVYRPDIDGLRAVAVGVVLLYHAKLGGMSGGYVGVDVFFVLSGYLITQILARECLDGSYSILRFYERRIRRIAPALLFVLALTMAGGLFFLLPDTLENLGRTVLATLGFVSNVKFWRGNGYFGTPAEFQPLLHTWSLAIEEQFYILWPLFLILFIGGARRRWGVPLIWAGFLLSLLLSIAGAWLAPAATFLLLPTRGWELMCGAILALDLVPRLTTAASRAAAGFVGIAAVVVPCFLYNETTLFPGLAALPPCFGSALLIQAGRDGDHPVGRFLTRPAMVGFGLISYSLYLVHFPMLGFARLAWADALPWWLAALVLVVSTGLAYVSWRFVERPFRDRTAFPARRLIVVTGLVTAIVAAAAIQLWRTGGLPERFDRAALAWAAASADFDAASRACIGTPIPAAQASPRCFSGTVNAPPAFLLWGDSHAAALMPALHEAIRPASARLIATNACPPLLDHVPPTMAWRDGRACRERNARALDELATAPQGSTIVITAFWPTYRTALEQGDRAALLATTTRNLERLSNHRVVILLDTPSSRFALPPILALNPDGNRSKTVLDAHRDDPIEAIVREAATGRSEVYSLADVFCPPSGPCEPLAGGRPILSDSNHLAASVARDSVAPWLRTQLMHSR